jgi:tRNA pseudouridine38-40 synthase
MARYVLEVMYDGTQFHGSQIQGALPTVQLAINKTLATLLRVPAETFGASRTDEGVHALCNFYHFDYEGDLRPDFMYKCNAVLPMGIAVRRIFRATNPEFNARFAATTRRYRYRIYRQKNPFLHGRALYYPFHLDLDILKQTAEIIPQFTHFESFSKRNTQSKTFTCRITTSHWEQTADELQYTVEGNRFLRGMVRGLVGTQIQVARQSLSVDDFRAIFHSNDCTKAYFNVTGNGLYLEHIGYPEGALELLQGA